MPRNPNTRSGSRRGTNNNPEGKNQYNSGLFSAARDRPATAAVAAAGAVAAGVFLWSKRAQISDQLSQLTDQIGEWTDHMSTDRTSRELETVDSNGDISPARRNRSTTGSGRSSAGSSNSANSGNSESPVA